MIVRENMQIFDAGLACKIGLIPAIVNQMLIQKKGLMAMWGDAEHGVFKERDRTWYRFDDDALKRIFPYLPTSEIHTTLEYLEGNGFICCRRGTATDYIWIA